jgi:hypothetical protein
MLTAKDYIDGLGMQEHVEGGYCQELFQSGRRAGDRPLASSIYYLLKAGQVSKLHRLKSDELWLYHCGTPLLIHQIDETGNLSTARLGVAVDAGELPQVLVSGNRIFGAELAEAKGFCLVSCVVSPGFDYRDFELFSASELIEMYPQHTELIQRLNGA